jgi:hypothetical protein
MAGADFPAFYFLMFDAQVYSLWLEQQRIGSHAKTRLCFKTFWHTGVVQAY